ncbi:MAG: hypothetical protein COU35_04015 [Candidatus Magasanikbacteria bacterium CG10_big_fil_rev_8_21_14_0_10_47_10]|uniref:Uncharacterized protein n=1 Tax=Candidatus Magasanikbacteria bacterium CG10_big_fil_rev_8_21_14_0_10_47_10 TaxID=1974652 RepID=A0A2H0TS09_9BACT|nr:MAG: hypothetical protein COU35_04015 [Candidatus Magasanikbacteria bacterium CG10_big_fil_rev_8_21_14_0_10_47_10]
MGIAALVPQVARGAECPSLSSGELFKVQGNSAVYILNSDLRRMYFRNSGDFYTWFEDFSGVVEIAQDCVSAYPNAVNPSGVNFRPGSRLIKVVIDPRVYAIGPNNMRHWISSEQVAKDLYGDNWTTLVNDVQDVFWPNYADGSDITESTPHNGQLIKVAGSSDVWYVMDGMKSKVSGALSAAAAGDVRTVSAAVASAVDDSGNTVAAGEVVADPTQGSGGGGGVTPPAAAGTLTVALSANSPASTYVLKNSTRNPFTVVNFTAGADPVVIKSLKVERTGSPASDGAFSGINIMKPNGDLLSTSYKTLNSSHQATFTEDITVPANSTVSYTIVGKIADVATYSGEVPKLSLVTVETDASLVGSLPITGNGMTINTTVNVADVTVTEDTDYGVATEEVGTENKEFIEVKLANSSSDAQVRVQSMKFNNAGSADDADVSGLELVVNGNVVGTAQMVSNYVYFDLSGCGDACVIDDGKNESFLLRGDIVGGSGRTLDFDLKRADDMVIKDLLNNTFVSPIVAAQPLALGNVVTINAGKMTVTKTNTVMSKNVAEDSTDIDLGSWNFKVEGESITVASIKFDIEMTGVASSSDFTNLKLVNRTKGTTLTGGTDGADDTGSQDGSVSFTDSFTLPIGDNELVLVGNLNADFAANDTAQFSVDFVLAANLDATGDVTGDAITVGTYAFPGVGSLITANLLTIKDLALSVTTIGQPAARTIAAGSTNVHYSTIQFSATDSSEDVRVDSFKFVIVTGATAKADSLQNIKFLVNDTADGSFRTLGITKFGSDTDAGDDESVTVTLSGTDRIMVKKSNSVTLKIYADLSASAATGATHAMEISSTTSGTATAKGSVSNNDITEVYSAVQANAVTVGTAGGQVLVTVDSANPSAQLLAAGSEVELAAFNFLATTTEDVELDYLYLTQVSTVGASSSFADYDNIWFEDEDGNQVGGTWMRPTSTKPYIDFTENAFVISTSDSDGRVLHLMANLAAIANGSNGVSGHYLGYQIASAADVVAKGDLTGSGANEILGAGGNAPTGKTHYGYKGYPVVKRIALGTDTLNSSPTLYKWSVEAKNADVALYQFTFDIATSGATVDSFEIYNVTKNDFVTNAAQALSGATTYETDGSTWTTNYSAGEITVPKGQTWTFELRASASSIDAGDTVTTKMAGDAAHYSHATLLTDTAANIDGDTHNDFIWSDKSAVNGHSTASTDWTNGLLVREDLPSTFSTASVLSGK